MSGCQGVAMWLFWMVVKSWSLDVALLLSLYRFLIIYVHSENSAEDVMYHILVFLVGEFNKFLSSPSFKLGATLNMRYKYLTNLFIK